jgi:hypothetical protein
MSASAAPRALASPSTLSSQSNLQNDIAGDSARSCSFKANDSSLVNEYIAAPFLSIQPEEESEGSDSSSEQDGDIDSYHFHSVQSMLTVPEEFSSLPTSLPFNDFVMYIPFHRPFPCCPHLFVRYSDSAIYPDQDAPYLPLASYGNLDEDLMLPSDDAEDDVHPSKLPSPSPTEIGAWVLVDTPAIDTPFPDGVAGSVHSPIVIPTDETESAYSDTSSGAESDVGGDADYSPTDYEDEHENGDEEYILDLQYPTSQKRRAVSQHGRLLSETATPSPSSSSRAPSSSSSRSFSVSPKTNKRRRLAAGSRNIQATPAEMIEMVNSGDPWACPVEQCCWVQRNCRISDLKRHVKTHSRHSEPADWVCCGIPVNIAHEHKRDPQTEKTYMYKGKLMLGGCMKTFARRDSLKRHTDNKNSNCIADWDHYFD